MPEARKDAPRRYTMLMASLPHIGDPFARDRTPMSRATLERRLDLLDPTDRETLRDVERVVQWESISTDIADAAFVARAGALCDALEAARLDDLAGALRHRLELRTAVAALRWRHMGHPAPASDDPPWGFGRWTGRIRRRWDAPDLGLSRVFPWIGEAQALLEGDDPKALEQLLLGAARRDLKTRAERHRFDFTAVALYVLRWDIADRWTRLDARKAEMRFARLMDEALAPLGDLFEGSRAHG